MLPPSLTRSATGSPLERTYTLPFCESSLKCVRSPPGKGSGEEDSRYLKTHRLTEEVLVLQEFRISVLHYNFRFEPLMFLKPKDTLTTYILDVEN